MIDRDKLDKEGDRLQDWLCAHDPATEEYSFVQKRLTELVKLSLEIEEAHDKGIERHERMDLEYNKVKLDADELQRKRRAEIREILWDLTKMGFSTAMTFLLILGTGHIEQNVILGQHKWSLIPKPKF